MDSLYLKFYVYSKVYSTVKPVLAITSFNQPPAFNGQNNFYPNYSFEWELTCTDQPPAFKGHCTLFP